MKRELTNQELLDRYIHAVKLRLLMPPEKMEDIAAEVRSNLESKMEDQAMALGRDLRPEEVSAMLRQYGHPAKVALRYRDQAGRGLISPALFPFYWFTLRIVLALWLTIRLIVVVFAIRRDGNLKLSVPCRRSALNLRGLGPRFISSAESCG
jgi:hypothetical protein